MTQMIELEVNDIKSYSKCIRCGQKLSRDMGDIFKKTYRLIIHEIKLMKKLHVANVTHHIIFVIMTQGPILDL